MCLVLVSYKRHPEYPLIVASNRDEFFSRPTEALAFRGAGDELLCGLDLEAGGTWLAAGRRGRVAVLTNVREPGRINAAGPTRGRLVTGCVNSEHPLRRHLETLMNYADMYNGFNLIAADASGLYYCSNRTGTVRPLGPGLYGLSNHTLDTPWPKLTRAKAMFARALACPGPLDEEALFAILRDEELPPDSMLPDTGVGTVWERILAPVFISSGIYGTRTSSIVLLSRDGRLRFIERTHGRPGSPDKAGTREYCFEIEDAHRMPDHAAC